MREAEKMGGGGMELGWLEAAILIGSILTFIVDQATGGSPSEFIINVTL